MNTASLVDLTPLAHVAALGVALATGPLAWLWLRHRHAEPAARLHALTLLTVFLTFDLVLFGAFTRLTDSGLGCPDWPGCYGSASPVGAHAAIHAAQTALPSGPVTHDKAWIEMVHRYLATAIGVLITMLMVLSWIEARRRRAAISPWWATATFALVGLQGAFGAWTVTLKLYPAVVTMHLLLGIALLAMLAAQGEAYQHRPLWLSRGLFIACVAVFALSVGQTALGGWVSTNYAVLACSDFPQCQGSWWPAMDFANGFTLLRPLGVGAGGEMLPFAALTAIHVAHRLGALLLFAAIGALAWSLWACGAAPHRRWALMLAGVAAWQFATGLSNVVLGWPLAVAVAHTGGAAALLAMLTVLLVRAHQGREQKAPPLEGSARGVAPMSSLS